MGTKVSEKINISAGLVILINNSILLVRQAYDSDGKHLSIPKGAIDDGEDPIDAAIRETYEETGVVVSRHEICKKPNVININNKFLKRRIIYYIVRLNRISVPCISIKDRQEIKWAGFVCYEEAVRSLQITQQSILFHIVSNRIERKLISYLLNNNYISREKHPEKDLYLYNYTDKCKKEEYWNEVTMWCRGLIMDKDCNVIAFPLKKFFEYEHLYEHILQHIEKYGYQVYEKKDGFLGIMHWDNGLPYICTRNSFVSSQAIKANSILYNKYISYFKSLNPDYTYFFEIVYPNDYLVIDYGEIEDLFLIGAHDNIKNRIIPLEMLNDLPFPKVNNIVHLPTSELLLKDKDGEEGYVLFYDDGFRLKIKFPSFKKRYILKHYE